MRIEPTGGRFDVDPDELFFSTTDPKGVIHLVNDVFTRLSRFTSGDLRGAPHNIIRHPDMPGAVFTLMWRTIQAGKPFAGYIRNLAADGDSYDVFATVTPLPVEGEGYLSVRQRPCRTDLYDAVARLYEKVRAAESELREGGMNRREAAEATVDVLLNGVRELGYDSYEDLQDVLVTAEVAERAALTEPFPYREGESEVHLMLEEIWREYAIVTTWRDRAEAELAAGAGEGGRAAISPMHSHLATTEIHIDMCGYFLAELIETGYDKKIGLPGEAMGFATKTIWDEEREETEEERDVRERLESLEMLSQVLMDDIKPLRMYAEGEGAGADGAGAVDELAAIIDRVHAKVLMMESSPEKP